MFQTGYSSFVLVPVIVVDKVEIALFAEERRHCASNASQQDNKRSERQETLLKCRSWPHVGCAGALFAL